MEKRQRSRSRSRGDEKSADTDKEEKGGDDTGKVDMGNDGTGANATRQCIRKRDALSWLLFGGFCGECVGGHGANCGCQCHSAPSIQLVTNDDDTRWRQCLCMTCT